MKNALILMFFVLSCAACNQKSIQFAGSGAPTGNELAVGPMPGIGNAQKISNPLPQDAQNQRAGRNLFVAYNCSGCHGGRAGGGMGPSLRDVDWLYGNSDQDIFNSIAQGRGKGMPSWGTRVPSGQIWQLVAYIKSLRTSAEPDAPK